MIPSGNILLFSPADFHFSTGFTDDTDLFTYCILFDLKSMLLIDSEKQP